MRSASLSSAHRAMDSLICSGAPHHLQGRALGSLINHHPSSIPSKTNLSIPADSRNSALASTMIDSVHFTIFLESSFRYKTVFDVETTHAYSLPQATQDVIHFVPLLHQTSTRLTWRRKPMGSRCTLASNDTPNRKIGTHPPYHLSPHEPNTTHPPHSHNTTTLHIEVRLSTI